MKKNFLIGIAMMVAAFFVGTEIAKAADVSFSGSIRTRYENNSRANDTKIGGADQEDDDLVDSQVRLNAKANINETAIVNIFLFIKNNKRYTL
jgi:hypothetical protein